MFVKAASYLWPHSPSVSSNEFERTKDRSPVTADDLELARQLRSSSTGEAEGAHSVLKDSSNGVLNLRELSMNSSFSFETIPSSDSLTDHSISTDSTSSSAKSQKEILNQKILFSSADFARAVGPARVMHGARYRVIQRDLKDYEKNSATWTPDQKRTELLSLQKKATAYLDRKNANGEKTHAAAATCLLNGIAKKLFDLAPITFSQQEETSSTENFAKGMMATVSKIRYQDASEAIFKPVSTERPFESTIAGTLGIPSDSTLIANVAGRNVGTYAVNKLLDWDVVPETGYATHHDQIGSCQRFVKGESLYEEKKKLLAFDQIPPDARNLVESIGDGGIAEELLSMTAYEFSCFSPVKESIDPETQKRCFYENNSPIGEERAEELLKAGKIQVSQKVVSSVSAVNFSNPQLQKTLSKAHVLDLLTGQFDRNPGNFIYTNAEEKWDAKLIDNDCSFPQKLDSFDGDDFQTVCRRANLPATLPDLIDQEAAKAITDLEPEKLRTTLQREAGLTHEEVAATLTRLQLLKDHIATATNNNPPAVPRLVTEWNQETFEAQKETPNNYVWMGCDRKAGIEARRDSEKPATGQNEKSS